jgi:hypothetical protein
MNSVNAVILVFAELPRDNPFDQAVRPRRGTASLEDIGKMTETWPFGRLEKP